MAPIAVTHDYLSRLGSLAEPAQVLQKLGFITRQLTEEELLLKRRCSGCNKAMSQVQRKHQPPSQPLLQPGAVGEADIASLSLQPSPGVVPDSSTEKPPQEPKLRCQYHKGEVINRVWTCCNKTVPAPPCAGSYEHTPIARPLNYLIENYQFHPTPVLPPRHHDIRIAVAIDCEMGTAATGDSELIRLTMVDYFSEEILVDNIVLPDVPMLHLNTKYSGVTWADIRNAQRKRTGLDGKPGARQAFWKYVGPDTIVVGHDVQNDLRALRVIHMLVVDSFVTEHGRVKAKQAEEEAKKLEAIAQNLIDLEDKEKVVDADKDAAFGTNVEEKKKRMKGATMGLKTLAKKYLDRDIQMGKKGHDSLEDAVAARDIVHHNVLCLEEEYRFQVGVYQ